MPLSLGVSLLTHSAQGNMVGKQMLCQLRASPDPVRAQRVDVESWVTGMWLRLAVPLWRAPQMLRAPTSISLRSKTPDQTAFDSQSDSHTDGLTAKAADDGGRKSMRSSLGRTVVDGPVPYESD